MRRRDLVATLCSTIVFAGCSENKSSTTESKSTEVETSTNKETPSPTETTTITEESTTSKNLTPSSNRIFEPHTEEDATFVNIETTTPTRADGLHMVSATLSLYDRIKYVDKEQEEIYYLTPERDKIGTIEVIFQNVSDAPIPAENKPAFENVNIWTPDGIYNHRPFDLDLNQYDVREDYFDYPNRIDTLFDELKEEKDYYLTQLVDLPEFDDYFLQWNSKMAVEGKESPAYVNL